MAAATARRRRRDRPPRRRRRRRPARRGEQPQPAAGIQPLQHRLGRVARPQAVAGPTVQRVPVGRSGLVEGGHLRRSRPAGQHARAGLQDLCDRLAQGTLLRNCSGRAARRGGTARKLQGPAQLDDQIDQGAVPAGGSRWPQRCRVVGAPGRLDPRACLLPHGGWRGRIGQQLRQRLAGLAGALAYLGARVPGPQQHSGGEGDAARQYPPRDPGPSRGDGGGQRHGDHERQQQRGLRRGNVAAEHPQELHTEGHQRRAGHRRPITSRRQRSKQDQPGPRHGGAGVGAGPRDRRSPEVRQAQQGKGAEHGECGGGGIADDGPGEGRHGRHHDRHPRRAP